MNIHFLFFVDDGEEPSHGLTFDLPAVPLPDDLVTITRPGQVGYSSFIVRRRQWRLEFPEDESANHAGIPSIGHTADVVVECSFAVGPYASEEHKCPTNVPDPQP